MATTINQAAAPAERADPGVARQRLLTPERIRGAALQLDRVTLSPGAVLHFNLPRQTLAWLHLLDGEATFKAYYTDRLTKEQSVFLPPGFDATLSTEKGATLLYAEIPDARPLDPDFAKRTPLFIVSDWTCEPVLACETDTRKRVPLVREDICDAEAVKIEMVVYPPNTAAPECRHEGAATVLYVVTGHGTATAGGEAFGVKAGDVVHFADRERHTLRAAGDGEMRFIEFHVPANFNTVWTDPGAKSAWRSTDHDIFGRETLLDARERKSFRFVFPFPV